MKEEKEKRRLIQLKERDDKLMKECSFKPNIYTLTKKDKGSQSKNKTKNNLHIDGKTDNQMTQRSSRSNHLSESEINSFYARTVYWKEEKMKKI